MYICIRQNYISLKLIVSKFEVSLSLVVDKNIYFNIRNLLPRISKLELKIKMYIGK